MIIKAKCEGNWPIKLHIKFGKVISNSFWTVYIVLPRKDGRKEKQESYVEGAPLLKNLIPEPFGSYSTTAMHKTYWECLFVATKLCFLLIFRYIFFKGQNRKSCTWVARIYCSWSILFSLAFTPSLSSWTAEKILIRIQNISFKDYS